MKTHIWRRIYEDCLRVKAHIYQLCKAVLHNHLDVSWRIDYTSSYMNSYIWRHIVYSRVSQPSRRAEIVGTRLFKTGTMQIVVTFLSKIKGIVTFLWSKNFKKNVVTFFNWKNVVTLWQKKICSYFCSDFRHSPKKG